jgi:polysaccharide export outer membrane protein
MCRKLLMLFLLAHWVVLFAWAQPQTTQAVSGKQGDPKSAEQAAKNPVPAAAAPQVSIQRLNERLNSMNMMAHQAYDYTLGPGDVIEINVIGISILDNDDFALNARGTISLPYVGEIELLGMTCREAETKIASLFEESLLVDPQVAIMVKTYRSQSFYIFGAVNQPGAIKLTGDTNLFDALTSAGGLTRRADPKIQIHRRRSLAQPSSTHDGTAPRVDSPGVDADEIHHTLDIDLNDLLDKGDMSLNIRIRSGDVISVPEQQDRFFYVLGDVTKPGPYMMPKNERITFSKAIAIAGGLLPTASGKKTTIMRPNPDGVSATQLELDATAVIKGQGLDMEIVENDIVLVPGSARKIMGRSFMAGITGFVTSLLLWGIR